MEAGSLTILPTASTHSTLASRQRHYADWLPSAGDLPATVEQIASDVRAFAAGLEPADPRALAVELRRTLALFPLPDPQQAAALSEGAMEALEGVPLDIAQAALKRVRMECKFFPRPSEIRERVVAELGERRRAKAKAEVALAMAQRRGRKVDKAPVTDEERAMVAETVARLVSTHGMVKGAPEPSVHPEREAIAAVAQQTAGFKLPDVDDPAVQEYLRRMGA